MYLVNDDSHVRFRGRRLACLKSVSNPRMEMEKKPRVSLLFASESP
jgi:hypothetical protein